jgi:hypothetical protein
MKKNLFILFLVILASIPALAISFYTYFNNTILNDMLLLGCAIEYLTIAIAFFVDEIIEWNKKEG